MEKCYLCGAAISYIDPEADVIKALCYPCYQHTLVLEHQVSDKLYESIKAALNMGASMNQAIMMQCAEFNLSSEAATKIESYLKGE